MSTERDKRIAEALGLCWHKILLLNDPKYCSVCICGLELFSGGYLHVQQSNPNFSTFKDMGLILVKGPERQWWLDFEFYLIDRHLLIAETIKNPKAGEKGQPAWLKIVIGVCLKLLQDPGKLADELYTFLQENKIC